MVRNNKAQAAMEFLMTYGWAILVVLLAVGALAYFGAFNLDSFLPDRTTFTAPLPNVDNAVLRNNTGLIEIAFKNSKGVGIMFSGNGSLTSDDCNNTPPSSVPSGTVENGETFLVGWTCDTPGKIGTQFKGQMSFEYINSETNQKIIHSGSVEGKWT